MSEKNHIFHNLLKEINMYDIEQLRKGQVLNVNIDKENMEVSLSIMLPEVLDVIILVNLRKNINTFFAEKLKYHQVHIKINYQNDFIEAETLQKYYDYIINIFEENKPRYSILRTYNKDFKNNIIKIYVGAKEELIIIQELLNEINKVLTLYGLLVQCEGVVSLFETSSQELINQQIKNADLDFMNTQVDNQSGFVKSFKPIKKPRDQKPINGPVTKLIDIPSNEADLIEYRQQHGKAEFVIVANIESSEIREVRSKKTGVEVLHKFYKAIVTDDTGTIILSTYLKKDSPKDVKFYQEEVIRGRKVRVHGFADYDNYARDVVLKILDIIIEGEVETFKVIDEAIEKRVELHAHTQMSIQDGVMTVEQYVEQAKNFGFKALAITDHANIQAAPDFENYCQKYDIKPIYGIEAYYVDEKNFKIALTDEEFDLREAIYVVYDIETTGFSSNYDEIIEIGACKIKGGMIIEEFSEYIKPSIPISSFITELTTITNDDVRNSNSIAIELPKFLKFCEGCILVAHNATFDNSHIYANMRRLNLYQKPFPTIDTLQLLRVRYGNKLKRFNLAAMAKFFDVELSMHHRAIFDAKATAQIFIKMLNDLIDHKIYYYQDINSLINEEEVFKFAFPTHLSLLAKNNEGKKALYQIISDAHTKHLSKEPRVLKSVLVKHRANLLVGSGCVNGEVFEIAHKKSYEELTEAVKFYDYIEIQPLELYEVLAEGQDIIKFRADIKDVVLKIIKVAKDLNKIVVATGDVHHLVREDKLLREIYVSAPMVGGGRHPLADVTNLPSFHFRSTNEMLSDFEFLGSDLANEIVVKNSNKIADLIEEYDLFPKKLFAPPDDFFKSQGVLSAAEETKKITLSKARQLYGEPMHLYIQKRLDKELESIINNRFATIYYISYMLVQYSLDAGYLVGSRGSVGSSLVAYMMGITEVNGLPPHYYCPKCQFTALKLSPAEKELYPLDQNQMLFDQELQAQKTGFDLKDAKCPCCETIMKKNGVDIPFETFLGFEGNKIPDIDLNFSGEFQANAHEFCRTIFGHDKVFRAGTISTVAEKKAYGFVKNYFEKKGTVLRQVEVNDWSKKIEGVKQSTGQHPGGIVVVPKEIEYYEITPIQYPADDVDASWCTTHYDYHKFERNLLKLDILGHDDPTMIRHLMDFVKAAPDQFPFNDVEDIPLADEGVLKLFSGLESLKITPSKSFNQLVGTTGIPEFGTGLTKDMLVDIRPKSVDSLLKISGLSHGKNVWAGNAKDFFLGQKPGVPAVPFDDLIGCRDDIMVYLISKNVPAHQAFAIMEQVRKGKGISEENQKLLKEYHIPQWYIDSCLLIAYMFPKAHATAYVIMALRIGWFKVYRPIYYYAAYFSRRAKAFDVESMVSGYDAINRRLTEISAKIEIKKATNKEEDLFDTLLLAIEMVARGFSFKQMDINHSQALAFEITDNAKSLLIPFGALDSLGQATAVSIIEARNESPFSSKKDIMKRTKINATQFEKMNSMGVFDGLPEDDQIGLFATIKN